MADLRAHARTIASWPPSWAQACLVVAVLAGLLFGVELIRHANQTQHELRLIPYLPYDQRTDYNYFYAAATMAINGEASSLYPSSGEKTVAAGDPAFATAPD